MNLSFSLSRCAGGVLCVLLLAGATWAEQDPPVPGPTAAPRPAPAPAPSAGPPLQWLSVVLVSADMEAAAADADDMPPAVRRVLEDVKAFLPFRSYRLHDAGLTGRAGGTLRLRGSSAAGAVFEVTLTEPQGAVVRPPSTTGLRIGFTLTEIVGNASTNVLRTSVTLVVGETVVVGTSRVRGQGLIAFITAVPSASQ